MIEIYRRSDKLKTDALKSGDLIEVRWRQPSMSLVNPEKEKSFRKVKMILLNPALANIGTMDQRLAGWNCQVFYDSHYKRGITKAVPYNKHYEIKWLKLCERQGNLKIISQAQLKDEANK